MWYYSTFIDLAIVLRPVISVWLQFVDGKAPLKRAAQFDLKRAVSSQ